MDPYACCANEWCRLTKSRLSWRCLWMWSPTTFKWNLIGSVWSLWTWSWSWRFSSNGRLRPRSCDDGSLEKKNTGSAARSLPCWKLLFDSPWILGKKCPGYLLFWNWVVLTCFDHQCFIFFHSWRFQVFPAKFVHDSWPFWKMLRVQTPSEDQCSPLEASLALMEEFLHQLRCAGHSSIYRLLYYVLYIPGGAGVLPSAVCLQDLKKTWGK